MMLSPSLLHNLNLKWLKLHVTGQVDLYKSQVILIFRAVWARIDMDILGIKEQLGLNTISLPSH